MHLMSRVIALIALGAVASTAHAERYSFACITHANAASCADGAATLSMEVTDAGVGKVDFTFRNGSALHSSITEIYFDDGTLLGIAGLTDSGRGVTFSQVGSSSPPDLPGGSGITPNFSVTAGFVVDTGNGGPSKGVENKLDDSGQEFVRIQFSLINNKTFADTLAALNGPLLDGNDLRVGLHVKSFDVGSSESFVSLGTVAPVPEPSEWALMLAGLSLVGAATRRRGSAGRADRPYAAIRTDHSGDRNQAHHCHGSATA